MESLLSQLLLKIIKSTKTVFILVQCCLLSTAAFGFGYIFFEKLSILKSSSVLLAISGDNRSSNLNLSLNRNASSAT